MSRTAENYIGPWSDQFNVLTSGGCKKTLVTHKSIRVQRNDCVTSHKKCLYQGRNATRDNNNLTYSNLTRTKDAEVEDSQGRTEGGS